MTKRAADEVDDGAAGDGNDANGKTRKLYSEEELERLIQVRIKEAMAEAARMPLNPLLQETFTPNDPVHGLMHLPAIVREVVDTKLFQRMRHIKQLSMCDHVFPGAKHDRFFHSLGTAFLAYELVKGLRQRQPDLGVTDRDILCATLAGLCHDLGHPCFSHMFEVFMHTLGKRKRKDAEEAARQAGLASISDEQDAEIRRYEKWNHEFASTKLLGLLFVELRAPLEAAGLRVDAEGDDYACIQELIDPPKRIMEELMDARRLRCGWSSLIKGRPVAKAWLYEVVSNWRSGIDVDKFDYFRRDALFLGIHRQFDHDRYLKSVKVMLDSDGVPTISPQDKDKDSLRENVLELRKNLHRTAYQHKTVKKFEVHMVDILQLMDNHVKVSGVGGKKMSISEAALDIDPVAYPKLTDTFVESRLAEAEDPALRFACEEYDYRISRRHLMRLIGDWDLPRSGEEGLPLQAGPLALPEPEDVTAEVYAGYAASVAAIQPEVPAREVKLDELRCQVAAFHYGMKGLDPITRILFHNSKDDARRAFAADGDAKPLRQKIFCFWNPASPSDDLTVKRLGHAFRKWAERKVEAHQSNYEAATAASMAALSPQRRMPPPTEVPAKTPTKIRKSRSLKIQASCPQDIPDPV